jgi:hypothetical protein
VTAHEWESARMMWWGSHTFIKIKAGYIPVNIRNEDLKQSSKEVKIKQERAS